MPTSCRQASLDDLDQIYALEGAVMPNPWGRAALEEAILSPNAYFILATEEGQDIVQGYAIAYMTAFDGELPDIVVAPDCRRQGLGRLLMEEITGEFKRRDLETLFLEVRQSNLPARGLYESLGFVSYHTRKNFYTNPTEDGICMRLDFK